MCLLFFFIRVAEDDDLAIVGWPQEIAIELTEETLGKLKVINDIMDGFFDEDITPLDTNNNPPLNVQGPITRGELVTKLLFI
jgi:hypothetical protein